MNLSCFLKYFFKCLLVIVVMVARVEASQTIKVGYIEFAPMFSTNQQGKPHGILIDLMTKVFANAGIKWTAESYPTKRMTKYLTIGKIDLWLGIATIPEFKGHTLVGESEVFKITMQSYSIGDKMPITSKADMRNKTIIIMRGYSYGGWINYIKDPENNVKYIETDTHQLAFKMLKLEKADYLLDYRSPANDVLAHQIIPELRHHDVSSFGAHFVVSKKTPNASRILSDIEHSYQELIAGGKL